MSVAATIERAAAGELPPWARVGERRRAHIARVAELLGRWSRELGLGETEAARWRAVGWLHDALRDAQAATLRALVPAALRDLPGNLLHGPAAACRLERDGVDDRELLDAVAYHTLGSPKLRRLGRALYAADFLEPGRHFAPVQRATLRARMPRDLDAVVLDIAGARIRHLIAARTTVRPETMDFWNALVTESDT